jgi:Zn-dependent protease
MLPKIIISPFVPLGMAAWVPWPNLILVADNKHLTRRLIAHELAHVDQWKRYGFFFPLLYLLQWVIAGFSYTHIRFEQDARVAEENQRYLIRAKELLDEFRSPSVV